MTLPSLREAETMLLERRRAQRGSHTLGDDADRALLAALAELPGSAADVARQSGRAVGEHVYSRTFVDDDLPGAVAALSAAIAASGAGALHVADSLHRTATVRFDPAPTLAQADPRVRRGYVAGVLEGYLGAAFNCQTAVRSPDHADELWVRLGEGRDVNARSRRSDA